MSLGVFKNHIFKGLSVDELYKQQMNGFNDPSLGHYQLLSVSSLMKEEVKREQYELEYIQSYLNAAKELANIGEQKTAQPHAYIFYRHSYALPILYLARHCMELAIKRGIARTGHEVKAKHSLRDLWEVFLSSQITSPLDEDNQTLEKMGAFISYIDMLDPTGTKLRYSADKKGYSIDSPLWVNSKQVVKQLELFVRQLEALDANHSDLTNQ